MKSRVKSKRISTHNNKRSSDRPRRKRRAMTAGVQERLRKDGEAIANLLRMPLHLPLDISIPLPMAKEDWEHAFGLLECLQKCHDATLYVPGIGSALRHGEGIGGIHHADPAWRLVDHILYAARTRCERELGREGRYELLNTRHRREQLGKLEARQ